jgi:hypothetical protein
MILTLSSSYRNEAEFKMTVCEQQACAHLARDARLMLTTLCLSHL